MEHKVVMTKASIGKRLLASVIDLLVFICFSFILSSILISPIISSNSNVKLDRQNYVDYLSNTGLFVGDDFETITFINEDYQNKIVAFYREYDSIENFNKIIENNYESLFRYDDSLSLYVPIDSEDKRLPEIYLSIMSNNCMEVLQKDENFLDLSFRITTYSVIDVSISAMIGGIIYYCIVPLFLKNGQTLGKKLLQLYVVSIHGNYRLTPIKLICRSLFYLIGELILSIVTFGVVPLISLLMSIFNNNRQSLHDFIVSTTVVDVSIFSGENNKNQILLTSFASDEQELFEGNKIQN